MVFVRRYQKSEMDINFYGNFFGEVFAKETIVGLSKEESEIIDLIREDYEFQYTKNSVQIRKKGTKTWDKIVMFVALTMSGKKKSSFNDYTNRIKYVIFDEYVPLDGRYASNEMNLILELYKSIDRDRYETQMLVQGNKIDPFCPFLDYFGIELDFTNAKTRLYRNNTLAVQIYANAEHREKREISPFNSLVKGTSYENYSNGGVLKALTLKQDTIENKQYWCSFISEYGEGSIWYDGSYTISTKQRKDGFVLCDKLYNTGRNEYIITIGRFPSLFKNAYRSGNITFESDKAFHIFEPLLQRCGKM